MPTLKIDGLTELLKTISPEIIRKAANRTLNELAALAKTQSSTAIRAIYNVKKARLDKEITIQKTSLAADTPRVTLTVTGTRIGLQNFSARASAKKGVSVLVKKNSGRKTVKKAFMARGLNFGGEDGGIDLIFKRTGLPKRLMSKGRYAGTKILREPIKKLNMTDPVGMMTTIGLAAIDQLMDERSEDIFTRNLDWYGRDL